MKRALVIPLVSLFACAAPAPPPRAPEPPVPIAVPCPSSNSAPDPHELWKQAMDLERQERWMDAATLSARAEELAPYHASYAYRHGYELVKAAEASEDPGERTVAYEQAKAAFRRCLKVDPNVSVAHHFLGEAELATGNAQVALDEYAAAIRAEPEVGYFYPPLADELVSLKFYDEAIAVVEEGMRRVAVSDRTRKDVYAMHAVAVLAFQGKRDEKGMIRALERAMAFDAGEHPDLAYALGASYAMQTPPDRERARELLTTFIQRVCREAAAVKYPDQCAAAQSLIEKLGPGR